MRTYLFLHQAPGDYTTIDQDLTFSESFGTVCTTFLANDDMLFEDDETFSALLTTNDGSVTLEPDQTTIQINDDDGMYIHVYVPHMYHAEWKYYLLYVYAQVYVYMYMGYLCVVFTCPYHCLNVYSHYYWFFERAVLSD